VQQTWLLAEREGRVRMATCPVCKIEVEEKKARGKSEYEGETYYFDSKACKKEFDQAPETYAGKK
jgi:YHS domain-containing protein